MSSLNYVNEQGAGEKHSDLGYYSQAVVISNIARLSDQGGWDNDGTLEPYDWKQQIENAFKNLDKVLRAAGFRGWEDVYSLRSYQLDINSQWTYLAEKLKERIPDHRPIWTALSVPRLAFALMSVKLEVEAIKFQA